MNALAPILAHAASALVDRADLLAAAEKAVLVTERKTTYPILANVRLRGDGQTMFITATDLDIVLDVAVPAAADPGFDITIPAHTMRDLLKGAPKAADAVTISAPGMTIREVPTGEHQTDPATGQRVLDADGDPIRVMRDLVEFDGPALLDFEAAKYRLPAISPDGWPTLKGPEREGRTPEGLIYRSKLYRAFTMPGADLFAALDSVEFAVSHEETRYYLCGVYMHVVRESADAAPVLRFVATDGHRMARQDVAAPEGCDGMAGVILPARTVGLLLKLLKPAKGKPSPTVAVEVTDKSVRFMFDDVTVTSKVVEGTFPDYGRVTPTQNDKLATFPVAGLLEAVKAVSLIASERGGKAVKLTIEGGNCLLSVNNPDNGQAESSFPITQGFEGAIEIGFNAKYLVEIVTEAGGDAVTMAFNDPGAPTLLTGARKGWLSVLMPMRV